MRSVLYVCMQDVTVEGSQDQVCTVEDSNLVEIMISSATNSTRPDGDTTSGLRLYFLRLLE